MESSKNIGKIKYEHIINLSEQGLEQLLHNLVRKYYQAFIDGDVAKMESTMEFINDIKFIVEDKQFAFDEFVNYCMLCNANFIIKTLFKHDFELKPYIDVEIKSFGGILDRFANAYETNCYLFISGADRINIRNLYDLCKDDPTINGEIMAIVDALHESFVDKEKYQNVVDGADE